MEISERQETDILTNNQTDRDRLCGREKVTERNRKRNAEGRDERGKRASERGAFECA